MQYSGSFLVRFAACPIVYRYRRRRLLRTESLMHVTCDTVLQPRASCRPFSRVLWTSREPTTQRRTRRNLPAVPRWQNTARNYWWNATIGTSRPAAMPIWPRATMALGRTYRSANQVKDVKRRRRLFLTFPIFPLFPLTVSCLSIVQDRPTPNPFFNGFRFLLPPCASNCVTPVFRLFSSTRPIDLFIQRLFSKRSYLFIIPCFTSRTRTFSRFRHVHPRHSICPFIARSFYPLPSHLTQCFLTPTTVIAWTVYPYIWTPNNLLLCSSEIALCFIPTRPTRGGHIYRNTVLRVRIPPLD